jgi:uncharacterized protein YeaO (DUF488 family)
MPRVRRPCGRSRLPAPALMSTSVRVKRIYEPIDADDGHRVLVDRMWPRGITRERAALDAWMPEVAPSTELRKWFGHDPERWPEFQARYRAELADNPRIAELAAIAARETLTLLYSARDTSHNQAVALAAILDRR